MTPETAQILPFILWRNMMGKKETVTRDEMSKRVSDAILLMFESICEDAPAMLTVLTALNTSILHFVLEGKDPDPLINEMVGKIKEQYSFYDKVVPDGETLQ